MDQRTAVVAGAGIVGLATAIGLARAGWRVEVLEQRPEVAAAGAGIVLWPNAVRALAALGAAEQVRAAGELDRIGGLRRPDGAWLARVDGARFAERYGRMAALHRADLVRVLLEAARAAGAQVRCGVGATGARVDGAEGVLLTDAGELRADLVVGADGIRSAVREVVAPGALGPSGGAPAGPGSVVGQPTGLTAWRWVSSWDEAGLPGSPRGSVTIGAGMEAGVVPLPGRRVYCYLSSVRRRDGSVPGPDAYAGWHDPVPALVADGERVGMLRNELTDLPLLPTYRHGPVVLVGDAAHAMTPHLGQGACQGLEDAAALGVLAGRGGDVAALTEAYDALRRPRGHQLQRASRQAMAALTVTSPLAVAARDAAIRALPDAAVGRGMARWVHPVLPD